MYFLLRLSIIFPTLIHLIHVIITNFYQKILLPSNNFGKNYFRAVSPIEDISKSLFVLSKIPDDNNVKAIFCKYCREKYANNQRTLSKIDEFELNYSPNNVIYWYTSDTFVHRVINRALCSGNIELIRICQFFTQHPSMTIFDLHQIKYQYNPIHPPETYFHGKTLTVEDLCEFSIGKLITFNGFTSTSSS